MMRDHISHIEAKIDSVYLTRMIRISLFGDHLAAYAEYVLIIIMIAQNTDLLIIAVYLQLTLLFSY